MKYPAINKITAANRRELVAELIEDYGLDPKHLLESLVAAMSDDEVHSALEYVARVEDWTTDLGITIKDGEIHKEESVEAAMSISEVEQHLLNHFKKMAEKNPGHDINLDILGVDNILSQYPDMSLDRIKLLAIEAGLSVIESKEEAVQQGTNYVILEA